jgi:Zn-dependent protease/CBS domain-containing protein
MGASWKIGRLAGIPIYVHWTFFILIAYVVYGGWRTSHDLGTTLAGLGFVLALFGCVVLHELGHALAARRYGVPTSDITLLPIGGIARLQRIPEHPAQELVVALAGPAVNVVIAASLFLAGTPLPSASSDPHHLLEDGFLSKILEVNVFLALFNLLPAFPMDGGRILRALLAMKMDYGQATRLAATVGQIMAIGFAVIGLHGMPMLLLIALFVWIGAESEAAQVQERLMLGGVRVRDAMLTDFRMLTPDETLGQAASLLLAGSQTDFPVMADGHAVGVLTRDDLLKGLAQEGRDARVGQFQGSAIESVEAGAPLVSAVARLQEGRAPCLLVVENGRPVGLLTMENIGEFLMVRSALAGSPLAKAMSPTSQILP